MVATTRNEYTKQQVTTETQLANNITLPLVDSTASPSGHSRRLPRFQKCNPFFKYKHLLDPIQQLY